MCVIKNPEFPEAKKSIIQIYQNLWLFWLFHYSKCKVNTATMCRAQCAPSPIPRMLSLNLEDVLPFLLTQVLEDDFSLVDVLLCFTSAEIDLTPSLNTREYVCQHSFSPWIMNNNWCCICCILWIPIHTCSNDKMFVEIEYLSWRSKLIYIHKVAFRLFGCPCIIFTSIIK